MSFISTVILPSVSISLMPLKYENINVCKVHRQRNGNKWKKARYFLQRVFREKPFSFLYVKLR